MKQRIFIGIFISKNLQRRVLDFVKRHNNLPVRFLKMENLHLTLVPPWYEEDVNKVVKMLTQLKTYPNPFMIQFNEVSLGPTLSHPRLIWATGKISKELSKLKSQLERLLGRKPEKRKLLPHLTLARFKISDFQQFSQKTLSEKVAWQEEIKNFHVIASHLEKGGARYEKIS